MQKSKDLQKAMQISQETADLILEYCNQHQQRKGLKFKHNDKYDPVTEADKKADRLIRQRLKAEFPEDKILSEESEHRPEDLKDRVWLVDPLDGTKDFKNGGDGFAVHIALMIDCQLMLGVVNAPVREELYFAERGKGAFSEKDNQTRRLKTNSENKIANSRLVTRIKTGDKRELDEAVESLGAKELIPDSGVGIKFGYIAKGEAEDHINTNFRGSKWDTAAPQIILEQAGGVVTDLDGNDLDYGQKSAKWSRSFIGSANQDLHEKIINKLGEFGV